ARPDATHGWLYAGRVGSGFSDELIGDISKRIKGGGSRKPTAYVPTQDTDLRAATWFEPRFVVEVFYRGIGGQQLLRQASLKAVRADKDIADLA
ncbi:ATP-dependent DNA ligase, partial [Stenotrophomonas maltophilia]|nr:ATP-dependent DNA ligase [Stenotrophomonas maltophilia]